VSRLRFSVLAVLAFSVALPGGCGGSGETAGVNASAPEAGMFDARADELEEKANVMIAAAAGALANASPPPPDNGSEPATAGSR